MNGEFVNQLWLAAPIYHIYYAAQCDTTTSKNLNKPEVVLDIQYMLLFLFGANTLNSTRYHIDPVYAAVFDLKKRSPKRFDDDKLRAFGAFVATVHIILSLQACSIVSADPNECHTEMVINAKMFKRAFASIESSPNHHFDADCAVLCEYVDLDESNMTDVATSDSSPALSFSCCSHEEFLESHIQND